MTDRKAQFGILVVGFAIQFGQVLGAAELTGAIDSASLVSAIRENAERLRSGEFVATGTFVRRDFERGKSGRLVSAEPKEVNTYQESITCTFDFDQDRFNFRRERTPVDGARQELNPLFQYTGLPDHTVIMRNPDGSKLTVTVKDRGFPKDEKPTSIQPIFDPRVMGFAGLLRLHGQFEELFDDYFPDKPVTLHNEGAGIWRMERRTAVEGTPGFSDVRSWWCDEAQGFQPVKYSFGFRADGETPAAVFYNQRNRPGQESEVTWIQTGDVWVPKTLNLFGTLPQSDVRLQLEIDWHNVNEPVASNVFDWKEWDLPNGTVIYDDRLHGDKKVILAVAGKSLEVELAPLQGQRNSSPFVRQLIVLNSIALGAAFGYVAMKWIGKRSAAIRLAKSADVVPTRESTT